MVSLTSSGAQGRAVHLGGVGLVGRAVADGGAHQDDGRPLGLGPGRGEGAVDGVDVLVAVLHPLHVPAVGLVAQGHVFGEGHRGGTIERDLVVVVQVGELAQLEVAGERGRLVRDPLHHVAVGHQRVGVVVDDGVAGAVVAVSEEPLRDGHADRVGGPLAERAGCRLDPRGHEVLGVAGRARAKLAEGLQVVEAEVVAGQVQEARSSSMLPWPADRTKRSRSGHLGLRGLCLRYFCHST